MLDTRDSIIAENEETVENSKIGDDISSTVKNLTKNGSLKKNAKLTTADEIYPKVPKQKSLLITYFLWLIGGPGGLHLLYLHRDAHAFIYWCTFGGYFLVGWIYDLVRIPLYVRDANEEPRFIREFIESMRKNRKPPFSTYRFVSAICVSYLWAQIVMIAIPQTPLGGFDLTFLHWTIPLAIALGVWLVGNIGREKGTLKHCLIGAYLAYPSRYFFYDDTIWCTLTVFVSAMAFDVLSKQWDSQLPKRHRLIRRAAILSVGFAIYMLIWSSYFYFNGTITDSEGDEVPISEAIHNFLKSPWWTDLKQQLYDIWVFAQHNGWAEIWKQIIDSIDADGEQNAYKVLRVSATASQSEIKASWKQLSLENHPDKIKDAKEKEMAQQRFMEIQQAYEILSKIKSKRRQRNKKYKEDL